MDKKGFTLVELLVVVAIIGILSIIIVPSVVNVNKRINERLFNGKVENIESSANIYATDNDDIFNGQDEAIVYVYELILKGYLTYDVEIGSGGNCTYETSGNNIDNSVEGCLIDPRNNNSINLDYVILRKQGTGYTATYCHEGYNPTVTIGGEELVKKVCRELAKGFENPATGLIGQTPDSNKQPCKCNDDANGIILKDKESANACIIAGDNPNNYLRYGDSKANWRVLGVYKSGSTLNVKIITNEPI